VLLVQLMPVALRDVTWSRSYAMPLSLLMIRALTGDFTSGGRDARQRHPNAYVLVRASRATQPPPRSTQAKGPQIINPQVWSAARFVRFSFMINLLWAFTPRIAGVLARDVGSCDRGDG
jgi:hypothetical protein